MKRKMTIFTIFLAAMTACQEYDDSSLWKTVDETYNALTEIKDNISSLENQMSMLSSLVEGGAVTGISENPSGGWTVTYKGADNEEHTIVIAAAEDVNTLPVIGVQEVSGILYWTVTENGKTSFLTDTDGAKIPVSGRTPEFSIDSDGYWTMNGTRLQDASGNPIKAEGKSISLFKDVSLNDTVDAIFTLGDGSQVTVPVFDSFRIELKTDDETLTGEYLIPDGQTSLTITYSISGEKAASAFVKIMKTSGLEATLDETGKTIILTMPETFETGGFTVVVCDDEGNMIIRNIRILAKSQKPDYYGIKTATDLAEFSLAMNAGRSIDRFRDSSGDVVLLQDVDMQGVTEWTPVGTEDNPFTGSFNGKGFSIKNISLTADVSEMKSLGLFGVMSGATVKNLTIGATGDKLTLTGTAASVTAAGSVAGVAQSSVVQNVTNNLSIYFTGEDPNNILVMLGGLIGQATAVTIGSETDPVINNGDVTTGEIANTGNGSKGMQVAGICGYIKGTESVLSHCTNTGHIAAPSGRGGGIAGTFEGGTIEDCTNSGLIEDDACEQYKGLTDKYNLKRMGGIVGGSTTTSCVISNCTNSGNVISSIGCRAGGFSGHNLGTIDGCTNTGTILSNHITVSNQSHGPGWACGYNKSASLIKNCSGLGKIGDYDTYSGNPGDAPANMHVNAVCHSYKSYDTEENTVDWTNSAYWLWEEKQTVELASGVTYHYYEFTNLPRKMHVIEMDLASATAEIVTAISDDIIPNPNGNGNDNNGKSIRETLSEICARKRTEGQDIVAGINSGFFDSNDGILRGLHISGGHPEYVNNKTVRESLTNHAWAFTVFNDNTASCGKKTFSGSLSFDGNKYEYHSINDTILRHGDSKQLANVYTSMYKKIPHSDKTELVNSLAKDALYVVAKYKGDAMTVNGGYAEAEVVSVYDGRTTALEEAPYLDDTTQVAIQMTGTVAEAAASLKAGDTISLRADVTVDGKTTPIVTQNSTMYQALVDGVDNSANVGGTNKTKYDPVTFVGIDKTGQKVTFIEVDGRQDWVSMGLKGYEMAQIGLKFGCWNMTRFDGGGSSAMWIYTGGEGKVVNTPSDTNGERSCLNYLMIKAK